MKRLLATQTHEQHHLLSAPATLALAIDAEGLVASDTDRLRILLINPEPRQLLDGGQWFRFVPAMLQSRLSLSITAAGVADTTRLASKVPQALHKADRIPVRVSTRSVARELADDASFDLAITFSQLPYGQRLLDDLIALRNHQIPLYLTSFSATHALFQHAVLRAHAADAESVVGVNPFALVSKRAGENWNRVLSRVSVPRLPGEGAVIDADYFDTLEVTAHVVLHSHRLSEASQEWPVGSVLGNGLIHTVDGVCVCPDSGQLVDAVSDQPIGLVNAQCRDMLSEFDPSWDETDRLIWAAHMRYCTMADGLFTQRDQIKVA